MDQFDIIRAMGIDVLHTGALRGDAALVDGHPVALVRPDLDEARRSRVVDWLLLRAVQRESLH